MADVLRQLTDKPISNTSSYQLSSTMNNNNQFRLSDPIHYAISNGNNPSNRINNAPLHTNSTNSPASTASVTSTTNFDISKRSLPPLSSILSQIDNPPKPNLYPSSYQSITANKSSDSISSGFYNSTSSSTSTLSFPITANKHQPIPFVPQNYFYQQQQQQQQHQQQQQQNRQGYQPEQNIRYLPSYSGYNPSSVPENSSTTTSPPRVPHYTGAIHITNPSAAVITGKVSPLSATSEESSLEKKYDDNNNNSMRSESSSDSETSPPVQSIGVHSSDLSSPDKLTKRLRKYACKVCDKSFTTSGHLARHARIHTGERNHICPFEGCVARFSRQDNCMQHYKTHLNVNKKRKRTRIYS